MLQSSDDITPALVTYGLISDENKTAVEDWMTALFSQVASGNGGTLLSSSVAGRSFTFSGGLTVEQAFNCAARAIRILNGRSARRTVMRFSSRNTQPS